MECEASARSAAIVAFGSSLTDGDGSTQDSNRRWPDVLAERLQQGPAGPAELGVLNLGIIGNRLLEDSPRLAGLPFGAALGQAGQARFERDVLAQAGVRYVIVGLGINDIVFPGAFTPHSERVDAGRVIAAYRALIARPTKGSASHRNDHPALRERGLRCRPRSASTRPRRKRFDRRSTPGYAPARPIDAVVDFDLVLRDPSRPTRLLPAYDSGDHMHPNDSGNVASGNAIPLSLFEGR